MKEVSAISFYTSAWIALRAIHALGAHFNRWALRSVR